jgi:hypothetical protein
MELTRFLQDLGDGGANLVVLSLVNPPDDALSVDQHESGDIDGILIRFLRGIARPVSVHRYVTLVRQNWERRLEFGLHFACFLRGISAQTQNLHVERFQFFVMLDELAEFGQAIRSPVSAIEVKQHVVAGIIGQPDTAAVACRECNLRGFLADADSEFRSHWLDGVTFRGHQHCDDPCHNQGCPDSLPALTVSTADICQHHREFASHRFDLNGAPVIIALDVPGTRRIHDNCGEAAFDGPR